jgi:hypothetical protein
MKTPSPTRICLTSISSGVSVCFLKPIGVIVTYVSRCVVRHSQLYSYLQCPRFGNGFSLSLGGWRS